MGRRGYKHIWRNQKNGGGGINVLENKQQASTTHWVPSSEIQQCHAWEPASCQKAALVLMRTLSVIIVTCVVLALNDALKG